MHNLQYIINKVIYTYQISLEESAMRRKAYCVKRLMPPLSLALCLSQLMSPIIAHTADKTVSGNKTQDEAHYDVTEPTSGTLLYTFVEDDEINVEDNQSATSAREAKATAAGIAIANPSTINEIQFNRENYNLTITAKAFGGMANETTAWQPYPSTNSTATGISNSGNTNLVFGSNIKIFTQAVAGDASCSVSDMNTYSYAYAYGINNTGAGNTMSFGNNIGINVTSTGGTSTSTTSHTNAYSYGIVAKANTVTFGNNLYITGQAQGGTANDYTGINSSQSNATALVRGIDNQSGGTVTTGSNTIIEVKATGGEANSNVQRSNASANVQGIYANSSITKIGEALTINAEAIGGSASSNGTNDGNASTEANAFGVENTNASNFEAKSNNEINVSAAGGTSVSTATTGGENSASANATGIKNDASSTFIIGGNNSILAEAKAGSFEAPTSSGPAASTANGIWSLGNTTIGGDTTILLSAEGGTSISLNTADATSSIYGVRLQENTSIFNISGKLDIAGNSQAGTSSGNTANSQATAYGIYGASYNNTTNFSHDIKIDIKANAGKATSSNTFASTNNAIASSVADGIYIYDNTMNFTGKLDINAKAYGGQSTGNANIATSSATANAINLLTGAASIANNNNLSAKAVGGEANSTGQKHSNSRYVNANSSATAYAIGVPADLRSRYFSAGNSNIFTADAIAGSANTINGTANASAESSASFNVANKMDYGSNNTFNAHAVANDANSTNGTATSDATSYAIVSFYNGAVTTIDDGAKINVSAKAGNANGDTSSSAQANAFGAYAQTNGVITFKGSLEVLARAEAGSVNGGIVKANPYALYTAVGGIINVNQTGNNDIKLTGNISDDGTGSINLAMDTPASYWRPLGTGDISADFGSGAFSLGNEATIDLSWANSPLITGIGVGVPYSPTTLTVNGNTSLSDGAVFLINSDVKSNVADKIVFNNITSADGNQYIKIGYDPILETLTANPDEIIEIKTSSDIEWLKLTGSNLNNQITGAVNTVASPMYNYQVIPVVGYDSTSGQAVITGINIEPTPTNPIDPTNPTIPTRLSETPMTAADAQLVFRNLWLSEMNSMIRRLGDLRLKNKDSHDGLWTRYFGGQLKGDSCHGRQFTQKYNGMQIGYDKQFDHRKGKNYLGFFVNHVRSTPQYMQGSGKARNTGVGIYTSMINDSGHYLDFVVKTSKLKNSYSLFDASNNHVSGKHDAWAYGLDIEYGYRMKLKNDWFCEPQAEVNVGRIGSSNYTTSNGVDVRQKAVTTTTARLGVLFGKYVGKRKNANIYAKISAVRDFSSTGSVDANYKSITECLDTAGRRGTSMELNLGTNVRLSKNNDFYLELTKSFGGEIKTNWQINAGLRINF